MGDDTVYLRFAGDHQDGLTFVEAENEAGESLSVGRWLADGEYQLLEISEVGPIEEPDHYPRRFELVRHEDNTGTSGTGVVAVGVAYPDGAVHMQWLNDRNSDLDVESNGVAFKPAPDGVEATIEIHGHGGRTEIRWIDD